MNSTKINNLSEKLFEEITEDDILIIEDKYTTRHIKISELMKYIAANINNYLNGQ